MSDLGNRIRAASAGSPLNGNLHALANEVDALVENPRDEYHTMEELYEYRMLYNAYAALWFDVMHTKAVKSWNHHDGEPCFGGGWFMVAVLTPDGWVTNHYKAEHWDLFDVEELPRGPKWDGHTPAQAAERLRNMLTREISGQERTDEQEQDVHQG